MDKVTSRQYTISAHKPHYAFSVLQNFSMLPNLPHLPDLRATHVHVCGAVVMAGEEFTGRRQVSISGGESKYVDEKGEFCFLVR